MLRIGIDLGGTKTEIIALAPNGSILHRRREPSPRDDYAATLAAIVALVRETETELGESATVGIGIPGAESLATGLIKNANSTWLIGQPLRRDLEALLERDIRLANDANCFALSEAVDGAGAGALVIFGVILGTGVGGGIVVNGGLLQGANSIAGEWGHCYLSPAPFSAKRGNDDSPPRGSNCAEPLCYCGRYGCVETYLSGPSLSKDHQRLSGQSLSVEDIASRAAAGDTACEASLQRYEQRLAFALSQIINVLDPNVIVLGGGLSNLDRLYANVPKLWQQHIFSDEVGTRLLKNQHGDSSGVRGAAWLWPVQS